MPRQSKGDSEINNMWTGTSERKEIFTVVTVVLDMYACTDIARI